MKNVLNLLAVFLITFLSSSCALGMGQKRACEPAVIPIRPVENICISNASGTGQCYNPITQKNESRSMENYICKDVSDYNRHEEWIESLLKAIEP